MTKITVPYIQNLKNQRRITALTAYDYTMARIINEAKTDIILVGDSLSSVVQGKKNTIEVTLDEIIYHSKCVASACDYSLLVADMPYMTYQESDEFALRNAAKLTQKGRAEAIKIEGGSNIAKRIRYLTKYDIPVMGHVGLLPQSFHKLGGHKKQGKDDASANKILEDAISVSEAGAFALVIECVPEDLAAKITETVSIPTIGIGSGIYCDGQIAVTYDLLGLTEKIPTFIQVNQNIKHEIIASINKFNGSKNSY